jgi:hypothetical protein
MLAGEPKQILVDHDPNGAARVPQHQPIALPYDQPKMEYIEILPGRRKHDDVARFAAVGVSPQPALWKNAKPLAFGIDAGDDVQETLPGCRGIASNQISQTSSLLIVPGPVNHVMVARAPAHFPRRVANTLKQGCELINTCRGRERQHRLDERNAVEAAHRRVEVFRQSGASTKRGIAVRAVQEAS